MPFKVGNGCFPAAVSDSSITRIARSDTQPEMSVWGKIRAFFCSTNKPESLELIRQICHPPAGTTREEVAGRFEQLRTLAYGGFEENVQSGRHGENHFCILDENSREMLSVTLDEDGKYTVKCQGHDKTHNLTPDTARGEECIVLAEGASGTCRTEHTAATTVLQTAEEYEAVWSAWENAAPPRESPHRAEAVREMRNCLHNGNPKLDLNDFNITSLPDHLPPNITELELIRVPLTSLPALPEGLLRLDVRDNQLTSLPALPEGLLRLDVRDNQLTSLPALPQTLQMLYVSSNQLTSLPALPEGLRQLYVRDNQLTSLPALPQGLLRLDVRDNQLTSLPALPQGLRQLDANSNQLTSLPALPQTLQMLYVRDNQLTSLPALPQTLQMLYVINNQLTSLPALPEGLRQLYVINNQLTSLPESIVDLPSGTAVNILYNPLSERTLQNLEAMTSAPGYSGPVIHFSMGGPSVPREARPLHLAVADWLTPAKEGEPVPADRWQVFEQKDKNNAPSFSAFLDRLSETENCKKDPDFKAQTASWLTQLAEDDELRTKTFAMATEATSSCEDRVTLALNQMKNVQLVHNAEKGKYDNNLPELVSAGREMFRLEKLEQIARDKVSTLRFVDEIEVYLGFQNKLKEPLGLTSVTKEMRFFGVSHITESDLQAAELQVKTAEKNQFREWILQWGPLHRVLERAYPEDWETLCDKKISDYDDSYRTLSDTELKPAGLVGNTDAERVIGARALESAEKAFRDGLSPLANKMLDGHLKTRWP